MSNVSRLLVLVVIAAVAMICISATAANAAPIMLSVKGTKQGQFKGESQRQTSQDKIDAVGFSLEVTSPRDIATGQASGKRQYKPLQITKPVGASSPQFFQAVTTNEVLPTVTLEFVKTGADGAEMVFYTIKLTNATVASVRQHTDAAGGTGGAAGGESAKNPGGAGAQPLEDITFSFQKIEIQNLESKTMVMDDWQVQH